MARIAVADLKAFTPEAAAAEFGFEDVDFDRPGIYRWLDEGRAHSDFEYLGNLRNIRIPPKAQFVEEYAHFYDSVNQARRAVREGWLLAVKDGVLRHFVLPDCEGHVYVRISCAPEVYQ